MLTLALWDQLGLVQQTRALDYNRVRACARDVRAICEHLEVCLPSPTGHPKKGCAVPPRDKVAAAAVD